MDERTRLETHFYLFRLHLRKVSKVARRLEKAGGTFTLKVSFAKDKGLESSFTKPDEKGSTEFAVVMSRFLLPGSPLYVEEVLAMLARLSDSTEMKEFVAEARMALREAQKGNISLQRGDKLLRSLEIYTEMAQNVFFCDDTVRLGYLDSLGTPVLRDLYWHSFYEYCLAVYAILTAANVFIETHQFYPPHVERKNHCVYCGTTEGDFSEVEHVIPEALEATN